METLQLVRKPVLPKVGFFLQREFLDTLKSFQEIPPGRIAVKRLFIRLLFFIILVATLTPITASALESGAWLPQTVESCQIATIHYRRRHADYEDWGLHIWGPTPLEGIITWDSPLEPNGQDDFGLYWEISLNPGASQINYIIHRGNEKDPGADQILDFEKTGCEIWQVQGRLDQFLNPADAINALTVNLQPSGHPEENQVIIHYRRSAADYDGWGLHVWGPMDENGVTWTSPLQPSGQDEYGLYWIIQMQPNAEFLEYIVHKGDQKDPGPDQKLVFQQDGREIWLVEGSADPYPDAEAAKQALLSLSLGDIRHKAQAHWLTRQFIALPGDFDASTTFTLHYDPRGFMQVTPEGLRGGAEIPLEFAAPSLPVDLAARYPHLQDAALLQVPDDHLVAVPDILKGQIAVRAVGSNGDIIKLTGVQIPGVLDDLYANDQPLGVVWDQDIPSLHLWAPTAKSVSLVLFNENTIQPPGSASTENPNHSAYGRSYTMNWDPTTGIWSIQGEPSWRNKFYQFALEIFVPQEGSVLTNYVTDPYSFSLSTNSTYSQIIDLSDPALKPAGWDQLTKPTLRQFNDIVLYELHVRDFSIRDDSIPEEQRGTFMAFTHPESAGMRNLGWLAEQGVTHIHLLPVFDYASVDENKATWSSLDWEQLFSFPPDSQEQQEIVAAIQDQDGYNWGYDPYHYTVPEGSYSVHPNGYIRTLEFRKMVKSLNEIGLRVVMDVVYNHTHASGQNDKSVLDRIVPGYYHRLDMDGQVLNSTCCQNTATEHAMMRRLMVDSLRTWAEDYKVDGFRFDLMGHHMKDDMVAVRSELDRLTPAMDGVDGSQIVLYGEGWDFGEVTNNGRGTNASQANMAGTGIGTFNDRLRDAVRGGGPFASPQQQGYATGLYTQPNQAEGRSENQQLVDLLKLKDQIRISLAGNLANYSLVDYLGRIVSGNQITINGKSAGYTLLPQENIAYVSAHDNETLFDALQYKLPSNVSISERVRAQNLALSLVTFSQGIPFYHAGSESLRSKSMDRDSYNSSDWFNAIDWTFQDNNWRHGLPLQENNGDRWSIIQPLLASPDMAVGPDQISLSRTIFGSLLQIRAGSPLFHLPTEQQVINQVRFHNTGPDQVPGLIAMSISDDPVANLDPDYEVIFVLFNADPRTITFKLTQWRVENLQLHPALTQDAVTSLANFNTDTQSFIIPGRSTVVFVGVSPLIAVSTESSQPEATPMHLATEQPTVTVHSPYLNPTDPHQPPSRQAFPRNLTWGLATGLAILSGAAAYFFMKRRK